MSAEQLDQEIIFSPAIIQWVQREMIDTLNQWAELKKAKIDLINYIDWSDPKYAELVQMRIDDGQTLQSFVHQITRADWHYATYLHQWSEFESLKWVFPNKDNIYGIDLLLHSEEWIALVKTVLCGYIMGRDGA